MREDVGLFPQLSGKNPWRLCALIFFFTLRKKQTKKQQLGYVSNSTHSSKLMLRVSSRLKLLQLLFEVDE